MNVDEDVGPSTTTSSRRAGVSSRIMEMYVLRGFLRRRRGVDIFKIGSAYK